MSVKIDYAENCPIIVLRIAFRLIYIHRQGTPINSLFHEYINRIIHVSLKLRLSLMNNVISFYSKK